MTDGSYDEAGVELIGPSALEVASGLVIGHEDDERMERYAWRGASEPSPRHALEQILRRALEHPPCIVDFSGGRDSSAVLAVATLVARRDGLPLPIPRTWRFPGAPDSEESEWQQLVVDHLRLPEWQRVTYGSELDLIGPVAQRFLDRYGLVWPAPQYSSLPSLDAAKGGAHLTGEGGDEVFGFWRPLVARRLIADPRSLLDRRMVASVLCHLAPRPSRALMLRRDYGRGISCKAWLRPEPLAETLAALVREEADQPLDWRRCLRWHLGRRSVSVPQSNFATIAADLDVLHLAPFLEPEFVAAFARCGGLLGFASRTSAMRYLFADVLPEPVMSRESKAIFNLAYFTGASRAFAESWTGDGVDPNLVDEESLRGEWLSSQPSALSFCLLQSAWLHRRRAKGRSPSSPEPGEA